MTPQQTLEVSRLAFQIATLARDMMGETDVKQAALAIADIAVIVTKLDKFVEACKAEATA